MNILKPHEEIHFVRKVTLSQNDESYSRHYIFMNPNLQKRGLTCTGHLFMFNLGKMPSCKKKFFL